MQTPPGQTGPNRKYILPPTGRTELNKLPPTPVTGTKKRVAPQLPASKMDQNRDVSSESQTESESEPPARKRVRFDVVDELRRELSDVKDQLQEIRELLLMRNGAEDGQDKEKTEVFDAILKTEVFVRNAKPSTRNSALEESMHAFVASFFEDIDLANYSQDGHMGEASARHIYRSCIGIPWEEVEKGKVYYVCRSAIFDEFTEFHKSQILGERHDLRDSFASKGVNIVYQLFVQKMMEHARVRLCRELKNARVCEGHAVLDNVKVKKRNVFAIIFS